MILLIEDDKDLRTMIRDALTGKDFTVLEACDGKEALSQFKPGIIDLVITDLIMPEVDGLKVIMKIREKKPGIRVIAISGGGKAGPGSYLSLAKVLGADAVYSKPFSISTLVEKVENLLSATEQ